MFKVFGSIFNGKNPSELSEEDASKISPFIFCKWLASDPRSINISNMLNYYHMEIPLKHQYILTKFLIDKKIGNIHYISSVSQKVLDDLALLSNHFKISNEKAKDYLNLISKEELNNLRNMYSKIKGNR